ncbi:hypothetical protein CRENBAI_023516 [Crenichthys baileyi]|uniref:Uncharacterized protein n=1 Tax=Crenichthys baileyi TaxID=28760 RepID=A0AAV9RWM6_9TELE
MTPPIKDLADSRQVSARDRWVQRQVEEAMKNLPSDLEVVPSPLLLEEMELAPAGPGSGRGAVDLFTFLSQEAKKTLRRSAGLSVPQSAFEGSRLAIPCPGTGPLRCCSFSPPLHTTVKPSPSSRRKKRWRGAPSCGLAGEEVVSLPAVVRAATSKPASSSATAKFPRLAAAPPMPSSARCSEATPEELEERLRFFARQIKCFRKTSLLYSSPELMERIRQMEEYYGTAVRQFYCRPPSLTPDLQSAASEQPRPGLQGAAAEQPTPGLQSAAAEQPTSGPQPDTPQQDTPQPDSRPDTPQPDSRPDTPQPRMTPDPRSASTPSTRRRGRRKRDAPAQVIGGPGDASAPAHATEGLGDASAPAHATEGLGDASAPAHATEGLGNASAHATEGLCDASASAHATEGLCDASAPPAHVSEGPADASASAPSLQGFSRKLVLVLASEPCDEGFEEKEPPDHVFEGFKEQFVLVLASEPLDEGSASASEGLPGSASAPEGLPGSASPSEGSPGSALATDGLPGSTPPEFHRVSEGSSTLLGRHGLYTSVGLHVFVAGLHTFAADRPGLCVAGPGAHLNSVPARDDLLVTRLNFVSVSGPPAKTPA